MFDLFGAEMPLAVRFFLAFLIVLGLIGATAWAVRRFGAGRLGGANTRGRQPRLAVIDHATVDGRRRLILVRRDNVEHLLMIGGPTDVVVEPNIVRAVAAPRDVAVPPRVPAPAELPPRAIPLPETTNGSWPLQPEPAPLPRAAPRIEPPMPEEPVPPAPPPWPLQPHAEPPARPPRDTLAALADELSVRPSAPRNRPPAPPARPNHAEPPRQQDARSEPRMESPLPPRPAAPRTPAPPPVAEETAAGDDADQSLAEMAHRLEAALRKPSTPEKREARTPDVRPPAPQPRAAVPAEHEPQVSAEPPAPPPVPPRATRPAEPKPRPDAKQSQGKTLYDSLEQEMASLLGRPSGKT
jgi:flagellar protein FliO/FliZ